VVLLVALVVLTHGQNIDIEKARKLAKYSNVAYCSEKTVSNWDCNYCEDELRNFIFVKWLAGSYDTQGYMGYDDSTREIMVVFQGSASIANWIANLNLFKLDYDYPGVNGARVHGGFYDCAQSLFNDAQAELRALFRDKPGYKLIVTGHSQGAAMAAMVGLMIRDTLGLEPEIQTFGEPRLGNQEYADYWKSRVNGTINRFTHKRDPVPQLPPDWLGFHHHPTEIWLQDSSGSDYDVCDWSGEDPDCHNSVWLPVDIFDHLWYLDIYLGIPCF